MDCTRTCKRPRNTNDLLLEEDPKAVRRRSGRRREQIQRQILRFLACFCAALMFPALAADAPFSHRKHAALKQKCTACHKDAVSADRAGFPAPGQCRTCHTEMPDRKIPSRIVHELPEFVFFSHGSHAAGKLE